MSRVDELREADRAGYYCLLEALYRLGLITKREGPIAITDTERALCFLAGVREQLIVFNELIEEQQWQEQQTEEQP